MGAPQIIADSLQELMDALNDGHRAIKAVEDAERERTLELREQIKVERHRAFEQGRRVGYAKGFKDGAGFSNEGRDSAYAAGFAEGAALASKRGAE